MSNQASAGPEVENKGQVNVQPTEEEKLDRQDSGEPLTAAERDEAEGLANLAEFLTLLRLRMERSAQ
jgi:hypothetical protein